MVGLNATRHAPAGSRFSARGYTSCVFTLRKSAEGVRNTRNLRCAFCGKNPVDVRSVIEGPNVEDVMAAELVYRRAVERGVGVELEL